jgi:adenine-specific DNA methylase
MEQEKGFNFTIFSATNRKCFILIEVIRLFRGITMAKCPTCGKEVKNAKKTWKMAGKPDKKGKRTQLTIALYDCCGKTFREVLDKKKI